MCAVFVSYLVLETSLAVVFASPSLVAFCVVSVLVVVTSSAHASFVSPPPSLRFPNPAGCSPGNHSQSHQQGHSKIVDSQRS